MTAITEIIDLHSHILPGLDDGPSSREEALEMLRLAWEQGITGVIASPHYSECFLNDDPNKIEQILEEIRELLTRHKIPLRLYAGQELTYMEDLPRLLREGTVLSLAGGRYVLIEFLPCAPYLTILYAVQDLTQAGYRPVLAHVERYRALYSLEKVDVLRKKGALMQMNYHSVTGRFWDKQVRWCRRLLLEGRIDFMGTDMHDMNQRKPQIAEALRWMEKHLDQRYLVSILAGNARKLLSDR